MSQIDPVAPGGVPVVDRPDAKTRRGRAPRKRKDREEDSPKEERPGGRNDPPDDAERDEEGTYGEIDVYL